MLTELIRWHHFMLPPPPRPLAQSTVDWSPQITVGNLPGDGAGRRHVGVISSIVYTTTPPSIGGTKQG